MNAHPSILYRLWRIVFFPIVMLCLFIVGGAKALVTWVSFALIVYGLRNVSLGEPLGYRNTSIRNVV